MIGLLDAIIAQYDGLKATLAFLTILPVTRKAPGLVETAQSFHLFPVAGLIIGALAGVAGVILYRLVPDLLAGVLLLAVLIGITGMHHFDGLADFGDGLMYQGTRHDKVRIMRDEHTGAGGVVIGSLTLLATAVGLGSFGSARIFQVVVISEICAKFSMILLAWFGKPLPRGMGSIFIGHIQKDRRYLGLLFAVAFSVAASTLTDSLLGPVSIIFSVVSSGAVISIAKRHFGGVTGDVLGAANELTRLVSLVVMLVASRWI